MAAWTYLLARDLGQNKIEAIRAVNVRLGSSDSSGRQSPELVANSSHELKCDLAIKAFGFDPEDLRSSFDQPQLNLTGWGTLSIDFLSKMTSLKGVFAAGDIVRGASLVVWAIKEGRDCASSINDFLLYS